METNIDELSSNLRLFFYGILKTKTFESYSQKAGEEMKKSVISKLRSNPEYSFTQSGDLLHALQNDDGHINVNSRGTSVLIGYPEIHQLTHDTLRSAQQAVTPFGNIRLRPEKELPSWIIVEFGRRAGSGAGASSDVPSKVKNLISYSPRDDGKKYLMGPFSTLYHLRKPIFFMSNKYMLDSASHPPREHPGIRPGRIFRDGLSDAKEGIRRQIEDGIYESMVELSSRYGGKVQAR